LEISGPTRDGTKKGTGRTGEKDKWYSSRSRSSSSSSSSARRRPDTDGPTPKDRDVWMFERRSAVSALELPSILPVSLPTYLLPLFESVLISRDTMDIPGGRSRFQTHSRDTKEEMRSDPRFSNDSRNNEVTARERFTHHLYLLTAVLSFPYVT